MSDYEKLKPALRTLVDRGTLDASQALAAQLAMQDSGLASDGRSRKSLFSEALTFVGGAVVFVSAGLLLSQTWDQLGTWGRPGVIGVAAALLFIAAYRLSRVISTDVNRRLAATLFTGSAALSAFTIGLVLTQFWIPQNDAEANYWVNPKPWVIPTIAIFCAVSAGVVSVFGYQRAKTAVGVIAQIVCTNVAVFAFGALIFIELFGRDEWPNYAFLGLFVIGGVWVYVAEKELFSQWQSVAISSIGTLFIASQGFREQFGNWFVPTLEIAGGLMFLALYMYGRKWPFLAGGIGAMLIGGIELLSRYVEGISGALASMGLGIALLVLGTRLFNEQK